MDIGQGNVAFLPLDINNHGANIEVKEKSIMSSLHICPDAGAGNFKTIFGGYIGTEEE
jgi:hypothetical protein